MASTHTSPTAILVPVVVGPAEMYAELVDGATVQTPRRAVPPLNLASVSVVKVADPLVPAFPPHEPVALGDVKWLRRTSTVPEVASKLPLVARFVARIPSGISDEQAAPLMCAGLTVYKGLMMADADPGDWVVISGIGGLGHLAVQYARAMGYQVVAVDIDDGKLTLAARLGATMTINARETEPVSYVQRQIGGAHAALVTAVSRSAFGQAVGMMRPGGTVVLNGLPPGDFPLSIYEMVMRAITLRGSIVGTRYDLTRALDLAAQARITATVHPARLQDVNEVLEKMEGSGLPGRTVLEF